MARVVCFGDSNTWGCPPFSDITTMPDRLPRAERWTGVLADGLGPEHTVIEEGLSGRTTVFDDPIEGQHKNALRTILVALETHMPIELFIIMLGSNDYKVYFNATCYTSSRGVLTLIQAIKGHFVLQDGAPEILVVTPPSMGRQAEPEFWGDAFIRCQGHGDYLEQVAERTGCFYFDSNSVASVGHDGVHLDQQSHIRLGEALTEHVRQILAMPR